MRRIFKPAVSALAAAALLGLAGEAFAGAPAPAGPPPPPNPAIAKMNWLAGTWRSDGPNPIHEAFTPVGENELVSTLKMTRGGRTNRYEMRIIRAEGDKITFNELPFGGDLKPTQGPPTMTLVSSDDKTIKFDNLSYERTGENTMTMTLMIPGPNGTSNPSKINFTRVSKFAN